MEEFLYETILKDYVYEDESKKLTINSSDIDSLDIPEHRRKILYSILASRNIKITEDYIPLEEKEEIIEEPHEIVIENKEEKEEVVEEDFAYLDDYIKYDFIPNNIRIKVNKNANNKNPFPIIIADAINETNLSRAEKEYVFRYLLKNNITLTGKNILSEKIYSNYDFIAEFKISPYKGEMSDNEIYELSKKYYLEKDKNAKKILLSLNINIIPYIAWKLANKYDANINELILYGFELLNVAIDTYSPSKKYRLKKYLMYSIETVLEREIEEIKKVSQINK